MPQCPYCSYITATLRGMKRHVVQHVQHQLKDGTIDWDIDGGDGGPQHNYPDNYHDQQTDQQTDQQIDQQIDPPIKLEGFDESLASRIYIDHQYKFCANFYGHRAFYSLSWDDFAEEVLNNDQSYEMTSRKRNAIKIYNFIETSKLSRRRAIELIKLFQDIGNPVDIPIGLGQATSLALEGESKALDLFEFTFSDVVPYPERWCMDLWDEKRHGLKPSPVAILARDPIACISELFMDPTITFLQKNHLNFKYEATYLEDSLEQTYGDLYTSNWFKETEAEIRQRIPYACVLPIILYHDGVNVGSYQNVTSVLATCGNFSDTFQSKDKAKWCLGFITNIDKVRQKTVTRHLKDHAGFSKTAAQNEVDRFCAKVNQEYWKLVTKSIREHYEHGILLKVLGDRVYHFVPVVPFTTGDEPAQHSVAGVMSGGANRSCINCTFRRKDLRKYNRQDYPPRDADKITLYCADAENTNNQKNMLDLDDLIKNKKRKVDQHPKSKYVYDDDETETKRYLYDNSIFPTVNAFHNVYMGHKTSIYDIPGDLFHMFLAGLVKSTSQWIITIVDCLSKLDKKYEYGPSILDQRLKDFPYTPDLPHLVNTYFENGLSQLSSGKSKHEQQQDTGGGGGYRSSWWGCAILHILFCIGYHGDVLPNEINFSVQFTKGGDYVVLGNPTEKVFNSIYSLLNAYFQCKRTSYTEENILQLERDIKSMNIHLEVLWDLKQAVTGAPADKIMMIRKNHTAHHTVDYIRKWGSLYKTNTDRMEAIHQKLTTGTFEKTSGKRDTLEAEMLQRTIAISVSEHVKIAAGIRQYGVQYNSEITPKGPSETILFAPAEGGVTHWRLKYCSTHQDVFTENGSLFSIVSIASHKKKQDEDDTKSTSLLKRMTTLTTVIPTIKVKHLKDILHPQLGVKKFHDLLFNTLNEDGIDKYDKDDPLLNRCFKRWWAQIKDNNELYVRVLSAIKFEGSADSMVGKGIIYAKLQHSHNSNRPRFDFVMIETNDGIDLAQVLNFIEVTNGINRKIYAYVAWLYKDDEDTKKNKADTNKIKFGGGHALKYFERYKYGFDPDYTGGPFKCQIDLIESDCIMGPAYVIPDFKCTESFSVKPSINHRFFYVDRKFTDRSDWVDSVVIGPVLPDDIDEYLQRMAIDRLDLGIGLGAEERPRQQQRRAVGGLDFDIDVGLDDLNYHHEDEVFDDD